MLALSIVCLAWMHRTVMKMAQLPFGFETKFVGLVQGGSNLLTPLMTWSDEFSVGIEEIDRQHKHLMRLISDINEVVRKGGNYEEFAPILNQLIDYTNTHFSHEENLLKKNHCPNFEKHQKAHVHLVKELLDWKKKAESSKDEKLNQLMILLRIWFPGHILETDKRDAPYLNIRHEEVPTGVQVI